MTARLPDDTGLATTTRLDPPDVDAVLALVRAAAAADGQRPLSEQAELRLRRGGEGGGQEVQEEPVRHVLLSGPDGALGYAQVESGEEGGPASAELVVHPTSRRRGAGTRLLRAVETLSPGGVRVWAHGDLAGARALAASAGYRRARELWRMRRDLAGDLPDVDLPEGVSLRAFRPGQDDEAWLTVNARAFANHPEQGSMTHRDLRDRMAEPWFDPQGFLVAEDAGTGRMLGFHWTKVHDGTAGSPPVGEVYVVGVDPAAQGRRLGPALTLAGLHHLRDRGLTAVILYVESDNHPAVRVYSGLGFERVDTDVMYAGPGGA